MLEELGLADLVDAVVLSCEIGCAKPSSAIYRSALDRLGVEALLGPCSWTTRLPTAVLPPRLA